MAVGQERDADGFLFRICVDCLKNARVLGCSEMGGIFFFMWLEGV